jgi:hypothetical protein
VAPHLTLLYQLSDVELLTAERENAQGECSQNLVHDTRKNIAECVAAGQGLPGSGDIHAFGDSNLYLRRTDQYLILSSDHRVAPPSSPIYLRLTVTEAAATHLEVISVPDRKNKRRLQEQVLDLLAQSDVLAQMHRFQHQNLRCS